MSDSVKEKTIYATYNGLNRPAMQAGVPLMLLLSVGFIALLGGFLAVYFLGLIGLILPAICFLFLFVVHLFCEDDPNALRYLRLKLSGLILKVIHRDSIIGFSSDRRS